MSIIVAERWNPTSNEPALDSPTSRVSETDAGVTPIVGNGRLDDVFDEVTVVDDGIINALRFSWDPPIS